MFQLSFRFLFSLSILALSVSGCRETERHPSAHRSASPVEPSSGPPAASGSARSAEPEPVFELEEPLNVLLILVDSLRWDMPWTGYERDIAPWMTAFSKKATVYTRAYALSSYTAKSVGGLLAGRYPSEMHRDGKFFERWTDDKNVFISEMLRDAGHHTLAGHAHGYFSPAIGCNQGFDDWRLLPGGAGVKEVAKVTSEMLTGLAKRILSKPENVSQKDGKRFFAYFHYMDPHFTYEFHPGHPKFGPEPRDTYDNEVHYADKWVGELVDWVFSQPYGKDTAVIISADHGEAFGEHGFRRHAYEVWEAIVHVPMLIHLPGAKPRRLDVRRSHIDLAPTIAELMGIKPDPPFRGESLVPELLGAKPEVRRIVIDLPRCNLQDRRRAVIAENGYKLIAFGDDDRFELYNLDEDPLETEELSQKEPEMLQKMKAIYEAESAKIPLVEVSGSHPLKGAPKDRRW